MQQRSTKGASKQRRELINSEILKIRDLLPVAESVRSRLSQLQVMSLCNAYVGKCNFFENTIPVAGDSAFRNLTKAFQLSELSELLPGFLMVVTLEGKMLYLSENVLEYLGHSMVDILTHVDTIYDLVESADRKVVKEILDGLKSGSVHSLDERPFVCRMGLTKKLHQTLGISDQKSMQVRGWLRTPPFHLEFQHPVFMALCTPRLNAGLALDPNILSDSMVYETLHGPDMKYLDISRNGEAHLGYSCEEMMSRSWYEFIHPDDLHRAVSTHKNLMYCETESKSPLFVRMQTRDGRLIWVCVFLSKIRSADVEDRYVCINQVITEQEAMQERPTGLWRDKLLSSSYGGDFALGSPSESEFSMSSGNDSPPGKCSGREEIMRRLKRKMAMKEFQRKRSMLSSSSTTPDSGSSGTPASQGGAAKIFTFDESSIQKATMQAFSSKTKGPVPSEKKTTGTSLSDDQFQWCDNSSASFSSSLSSSSSLCSNSVFPNVSTLRTVSPFPSVSPFPTITQFPTVAPFPTVTPFPTVSPFPTTASTFPGVRNSSPMPFGLNISCTQVDGTAFVTSMPTPKFIEFPLSSANSYKTEVSDEEEEVVNIVEEMMDGKPFGDGISTGKSPDSVRQKRAYELPILGPGAVDEFFREVVGVPPPPATRLDTSVEFVELNALSLANCESNDCLPAGQTSFEQLNWSSTNGPEVAESVVDGIWSEWDKRSILSALKECWYDGERSTMMPDCGFDYSGLLHSANDLPWGGLSSFLTVDCGNLY